MALLACSPRRGIERKRFKRNISRTAGKEIAIYGWGDGKDFWSRKKAAGKLFECRAIPTRF